MPAPFYNAIKGTTAGAPGTGAFTPNAASTGYRAWSKVPTGWIGLVRFDDASNAWELCYSYWNGTTLSRASTQVYDSSTGSQLTLTSAATATMIEDAGEVLSHPGSTPLHWATCNLGATANTVGFGSLAVTGTASQVAIATTNYLTTQPRFQILSATTANAQAGGSYSQFPAGLISTTAGQGGFEFVARFGASGLPTGPRLFAGVSSTTYVGSTAEPSALAASIAAFTLDSTDTNIQLLTKDGTTAHKVDTGIPLVANGWYEAAVWCEPGSNTVYGLLIRLDTGAIWFGSSSTNPPATGTTLTLQVIGGLNGTNTGTAFTLQFGQFTLRNGF